MVGDITLKLRIDLNVDDNKKLEGFISYAMGYIHKKQYTKYLP